MLEKESLGKFNVADLDPGERRKRDLILLVIEESLKENKPKLKLLPTHQDSISKLIEQFNKENIEKWEVIHEELTEIPMSARFEVFWEFI